MTMDQKNALIEKICSEARILPVITIGSEEQILPLADALAAGGLKTLEITLRSAYGLTAIRRLREERPELCVGAGTVLDKRMMDEVEAAGAQFIVSPGCTDELLHAGVNCSVPLLAGTSNASDIMRGYALGYRRFKLFPAEICGGIAALKALGGPFGDVRFCPTGGVNAANAAQYLALPNVMCVGGTWMIDGASLASGDWVAIRQRSVEALAALG
ncbi:bifunctional 4-hydroxy-2-oxoglutarate aldolase/2-dehydro-3-deoxy-phosphogluconate aldolase [Stutzerimonas nitrititolerans]|uniref:bifunctional 4-hydroxy-2-oxoglutarate aldolase/2-dehydro-3-deoxy-phosphogluconate aldolase n=1 Tax=Stutzerimonas nitrititolerans TaxID=2482751 RepID=UPI00026D720B|nr:bifunctional 4-hydroxy-2-oxoglutarate aldolase/2-dehydro-3-deoxy-phosphogluconate aldolase [Stutzerimonas nitrititolerans]AFN78482.1 keto-hydroxyglutarate-aldolase/keto-deoxy-phosphogluconate aldolase [Stutzerimonas stutzeri DSM 10701]MBT1120805.1 bifunctional 4-hydroxy-2-oxoglutarate aldolase/2-dehydro-3-deoxy-phosphogluconate aldolase [Stutzerimonas nitrititolerans]SUD84169.1 keto-hydroxyglutarate-aldolase/keto-deoxy-phosphogluconate aldolase [Stutzerimonas stutzeri]HAQ26073.1 keto-deoxy-p